MFIGFDWVCSEKQDNNYIHMKSKILTLILTLFITFNINAQDSLFVKVPKQYSFEFGYRNLFGQSNFANSTTHGYGALFDYAWQLSGFKGKKAKSFITVPMGYTVLLPDDGASKQINMLNYGWTVRHELSRLFRLWATGCCSTICVSTEPKVRFLVTKHSSIWV